MDVGEVRGDRAALVAARGPLAHDARAQAAEEERDEGALVEV